MTAPRRDSRSMLERARELRRLSPYEIHERPTDALAAISMLLDVAESALAVERGDRRREPDLSEALSRLVAPYVTQR